MAMEKMSTPLSCQSLLSTLLELEQVIRFPKDRLAMTNSERPKVALN